MPANSFDWANLLRNIKYERVVPIIGDGLMTVVHDGREQRFTHRLAQLVATELEVELGPDESLRSLATRTYRKNRKSLRGLILDAHEQALRELEYGDTLRRFCTLGRFPLILTTAIDTLLTQALTAQNGVPPFVVDIGPSATHGDLPPDYPNRPHTAARPMVVHLFGDINPDGHFALTDEMVLDWLWHPERPDLLLDELRDRDLLFVGNLFPDWLERMFMRSLRRESLSRDERHKAIAEQPISPDSEFGVFLESLGENLSIYDGDVHGFVAELDERLRAYMGDNPEPSASSSSSSSTLAAANADVFISYASEDREAVRTLQERLRAKNLTVWFDANKLHLGDAYANDIRNAIESCDLFVVVLSKTTEQAGVRFFRQEWNWAIERSQMMPDDWVYIVPIVIDDDLDVHQLSIPRKFKQCTIEVAPAGQLSDTQLEYITRALRRIRGHRR